MSRLREFCCRCLLRSLRARHGFVYPAVAVVRAEGALDLLGVMDKVLLEPVSANELGFRPRSEIACGSPVRKESRMANVTTLVRASESRGIGDGLP